MSGFYGEIKTLVLNGINIAVRVWGYIVTLRPYRAFSRFTDVGGSVLTAGMSFQALFAVFAALWVGFGFVGSWLQRNVEILTATITQINTYVPGLIAVDGSGIIPLSELINRGGFQLASIIGSISLVWVAMTWFTGTRRAVRLIFGLEVKQYRNAVSLKIRDFLGAMVFFVALMVSAVLTVLSSGAFDWLVAQTNISQDSWLVGWLGLILRYGLMLIVDVLIFIGIHRYLAEVHVPIKHLFYGSLLGASALAVLKYFGTFLLERAGSNPLLVSFAVFVGLLVWFNLICRVLLLTSAWIATGLDKTLGLPERAELETVDTV